MGVVFGGRKAKEMYYGGRKIREAWYEGRKVYGAESSGKPVEVIPGDLSFWGAQDWLRNKLSDYGEDYRTATEIPFGIDVSQTPSLAGMFQACASLVTAPRMDTRHIKNMNRLFAGCKSLIMVPTMSIGRAHDVEYMFSGCSSLVDGQVKLVRDDGTKPPYTNYMIAGSGLTHKPFYRPDGTPID